MSKKKRRQRGSRTHGYGSSKKHRGAGSRGGRGRAGLGKKSKHKKVTAVREGALKNKGFKRPQKVQTHEEGINLMQIDQQIEQFVEDGSAEKDGDSYVFNAQEAGFDKVLGKGRLTKNIDIHAERFSSKAEEKLAENGNEAVVLED